VIDEEMVPDGGAGVDIDPRLAVDPFGQHPRDQGNTQFVHDVRDAVDRDRFQSRIAEDHFIQTAARGVAVEGRLHVQGQDLPQVGKLLQHRNGDPLALGLEINVFDRVGPLPGCLVAQRAGKLRGQLVVQAVDQVADVIGNVSQVQPLAPPIAGIHDLLEVFGRFDHHLVIGQRKMAQVVDGTRFRIGAHQPVGQVRKLLFQAEVGGHDNCSV
jgi:hypothetical protein